MQNSIHKKRIFHGIPIESLWLAITDSQQLEEWFMENNFKALENSRFEFLDKPGEKWKGIYSGEVISNQPMINIAYSWVHKKLKYTTYVWWKLESDGQDITLELRHSGFRGIRGLIASFHYARFWNSKLKNLLFYLTRERDKIVI